MYSLYSRLHWDGNLLFFLIFTLLGLNSNWNWTLWTMMIRQKTISSYFCMMKNLLHLQLIPHSNLSSSFLRAISKIILLQINNEKLLHQLSDDYQLFQKALQNSLFLSTEIVLWISKSCVLVYSLHIKNMRNSISLLNFLQFCTICRKTPTSNIFTQQTCKYLLSVAHISH